MEDATVPAMALTTASSIGNGVSPLVPMPISETAAEPESVKRSYFLIRDCVSDNVGYDYLTSGRYDRCVAVSINTIVIR